jgi:hypothetical protein
MPTYNVCFACHGGTEKRDFYPYELELQKHSPEVAFEARPRFHDLRFSHAVHFERNVPCADCHRELDDPETRVTSVDFCAGCHREEGVGSNCAICHEETRKTTRPPSHEGPAWMRIHGRSVAQGLGLAHPENCNLCHSKGYCDNCHHVEKPRDHTEFFRQRGHGIRAGIERERCMACHEENFCVRCHRDTKPRDHFTAVWGGRISNHCLRCHEPLGESRCSVCHRGTPSHLEATPIPPPPHPSAASNCYTCHLRPPHADNGEPCTFCHR